MTDNNERWVSGFWVRLGAFVLDGVILGCLGFVLGLILEDIFVQLGGWGRAVGFCVALVYFGLMNSKIGKGQTIGKKLFKIHVVNSQNSYISVPRSLARYSIIGIPYFLNNAWFTNDLIFSPFIYVLSLIILGVLLSLIYLYIFNRTTRQSLHDVIVGTYVTNVAAEPKEVGEIWKAHYVVVAILLVSSAVAPYFAMKLASEVPFASMFKVRDLVMAQPAVIHANINDGTSHVSIEGGTKTTTYVSLQVFLNSGDIENQKIAEDIKEIVVSSYKVSLSRDVIQVVLVHGYDIGIWSYWKSHSYNFSHNKK